MKKFKEISSISVFFLIISLVMILSITLLDKETSFTERRTLEQFPQLTNESVKSGEYFSDLESYLLDQFPVRDEVRTVKQLFATNIFLQKDNQGAFVINDSIYMTGNTLNKKSINKFIEKLNLLKSQYMQNCNVYCAIIPEKSYYIAKEYNYAYTDFDKMSEIIKTDLRNIEFIDISNSLTTDDYYRTDLHWKQENLEKVLQTIGNSMEFNPKFNLKEMTRNQSYPFYGAYHTYAMNIEPDVLTYLTNDEIEMAIVNNLEKSELTKVYQTELLKNIDSYDIYLHGATPLITISNENCEFDNELIIFRDSNASSLAPLLIGNYKKITLVDLRYMSSSLLEDYLTFDTQDILFLYGTQLVNNSDMLK